MKQNNFFVVPCNDLEAKAIIDIMNDRGMKAGVDFAVTEQKWGANYDNLEPEIKVLMSEAYSQGKEVYTVEISGSPDFCHEIDHHGDKADRPSSLEQFAEVVDHKLTDFERAVSANDKGGMIGLLEHFKDIGYTDTEAKNKALEVRQQEYEVTGITQDVIEKSDNAHVETFNDVTIAQLEGTTSTGYLADKLVEAEKNGLLIVSSDGEGKVTEVNFYGPKDVIDSLSEKYSNSWSGGGQIELEGTKVGFFGMGGETAKDYFDTSSAKEIGYDLAKDIDKFSKDNIEKTIEQQDLLDNENLDLENNNYDKGE